jgi:hypothetical protein
LQTEDNNDQLNIGTHSQRRMPTIGMASTCPRIFGFEELH